MAGVPVNFDIPAENTITNYNFMDIVTGLGYIELYGVRLSNSTTTTYLLNPKPLISNGNDELLAAGTYDFDSDEFKKQTTILGNVILQVETLTTSGITLTATIKLVRGASVTDLSSAVVSGTTSAADSNILLPIPITKTILKPSDKIRVTLVVSHNHIYLSGRSAGNDSPLKFFIPTEVKQ